MKEATGEVSMTVVTLVAIAVIGTILAFMWPSIQSKITELWNGAGAAQDGELNNPNAPKNPDVG